jgi:hypothetical protein
MIPKKASSASSAPLNMQGICSLLTEENARSAFPASLVENLLRTASRIGVSVWMLILPMTSSCSFFLGPGSVVKVEDLDWTVITVHWGWVVAHSGFGKSQSRKKIDKNIEAVEAQINDIIKAKALETLDPDARHEDSSEYEDLMQKVKLVKIQLDGAVRAIHHSCLVAESLRV